MPKADLVGSVQVALQNQALRVADALPFAEVLRDELASFQLKVTDKANLTFDAMTGHHDDLVVAVALCSWWVANAPQAADLW